MMMIVLIGIDGDDDYDCDDIDDDRDSDDKNEANDLSLFPTLPDVGLLAHHHHRPQGGATGHTNTHKVIFQHKHTRKHTLLQTLTK